MERTYCDKMGDSDTSSSNYFPSDLDYDLFNDMPGLPSPLQLSPPDSDTGLSFSDTGNLLSTQSRSQTQWSEEAIGGNDSNKTYAELTTFNQIALQEGRSAPNTPTDWAGRAGDMFPNGDTEKLPVANNVMGIEAQIGGSVTVPVVPSPSVATPSPIAPLTLPKNLDEYPNIDSEFGLKLKVHPTKDSDGFWKEETRKFYIKPYGKFTTTFSFTQRKRNEQGLFLRAMVVNTTPSRIHEAIKRCNKHMRERQDAQVPAKHILKCHNTDVQYLGDEFSELSGKRLSVVVPLGHLTAPRSRAVKITKEWSFMCANSCAVGATNKSTAVIFTLENDTEILGKKVMPFEVSTKPNRTEGRENRNQADKGESFSRKRSATIGAPPVNKVFRNEGGVLPATSTSASSQYTNEPCVELRFSMPNPELAKHVLTCAKNGVAEGKLRDPNNPIYANCMNGIEGCITSLNTSPTH